MIVRALKRIDDRYFGIGAHPISAHDVSGAAISELPVDAVDREGSGIVFISLGEILIRTNTQLVEDQLLCVAPVNACQNQSDAVS